MFFGETSRSNSNSQKEDKAAKKVASKGENIETEMNVSITEAFYGSEKKISLRTLNGKMKTFTVRSGPRQGCLPLSTLLGIVVNKDNAVKTNLVGLKK